MFTAKSMTSRRSAASRLIGLIAALILGAGLAGCSMAGSQEKQEGPIKIGILWPFSGANSDYGPDGLAGAKLALNEAGMKVNGRDIELVKANEDVLDPSKTLAEVKRLVQQENVSVMLGPVFGSSQQAVDSYLRTNDVMYFVPFGTTKELGGSGNAISWPTLDTRFSSPLGKYMADDLGYSKIATVGADYVYGHNSLKGATSEFEKAGGEVIQDQWVPLGTTDLMPYATHLDTDADALVMWLVPQDAATFVKDLRSIGVDMPIIFVNGIFDPTFQSIGAQVEGSLGLVDWTLGLKNDANQKFVEAYKKANDGDVPTTKSAAGYTDALLALETIKKAGSTDFEDLKKAVRDVDIDTPYGPGSIDENYFGVTNRYIVEAEKQGDRYVWEPVETFKNVPNN